MTGIYSSVRSSLLLNYESQESETEESEDGGRLLTNQSCDQRAAQTVWADAEAASRVNESAGYERRRWRSAFFSIMRLTAAWKCLPSGEGNRRACITYGLISLNKA